MGGNIFHVLVELIFLFLFFVVFAIRTSWFQTWLAHQASAYYSNEFGTEVRIDKVDISIFDRVDIKGVYIEDIKKDTFLYTEVIHADISDWSLSESFINLSNVSLENGHVHVRKYEGDSLLNFHHIIDYFASEEEDTSSTDFKVNVAAISLKDIHFIYDDFNKPPVEHGMDFSHIELKHLSGGFSDFTLNGADIGTKLDNLEFADKSGLKLTRLSAGLTFNSTAIDLRNLRIGINQSIIRADYLTISTPNGGEDWGDFLSRVRINAHLKNTKLNLPDLAYFVPSIWGMQGDINIENLETSGAVSGMYLRNVDIRILDTTRIQGNFRIPELSDMSSAFFEEELTLFRTSISDIRNMHLEKILDKSGKESFERILKQYAAAGVVELKNGSMIGGIESFVVYGDLTSGIGNVYLDNGLQFEYLEDEIYHYHGPSNKEYSKITVDRLNIGVIAGNSILNTVSGSVYVDGKGFDSKSLDINFRGDLSSLGIYNYTYNGIHVHKGRFAKNKFTGLIDIEDDNLALTYDGSVDLNGAMHFDFIVKVDSAHLSELSGKKQELYQRLASSIRVNIHGTSINELYGDVIVQDFAYSDDNVNILMDEMSVHVSRSIERDSIIVRSPYFDVDLSGKYDLENVTYAVTQQLSYVISNIIETDHLVNQNSEFYDLRVELKDMTKIFEFFEIDGNIADNSVLRSEFNHDQKLFAFDVNADNIEYGSLYFDEVKIENHFDSLSAKMYYACELIEITDSLSVRDFFLDSKAANNKFVTTLGWDGVGETRPALFAFETSITKSFDVLTVFRPSFFFLKDHQYTLNRNSSFLWNKEKMVFKDFKISYKDNYLSLIGIVSRNPEDWLNVTVHNFDLSDLRGFTGDLKVEGILNIQGRIADAYENLRFEAESSISDLTLDDYLVGDVGLRSKWDDINKRVSVAGDLVRVDVKTLTFDGSYLVNTEEDNLDMNIHFDKTDISFLSAFEDPELYTNIEGILDGSLSIKGELNNPLVTGKLDVVRSKVQVPMFNVAFGASGKIIFNDGEIIANHLTIVDQELNKADMQMQIYHYDWADWNYNVALDMENPGLSKKFLAMDTHYKEGDYYYGKAYVSGYIGISGYGSQTEIDVTLTTKKGTDLVLPMYGSAELEEGSFIVFDETFFLPDSLKNQNIAGNVNEIKRLGMTLAMKFNITKDAKVKIIFDPALEDQIVAQGEGSLDINMDDFGDLTMYGEYVIRDGQYEMRIKKVVEENFLLENGSTVQWTGSPYDADINIKAKFYREVALNDVIPPEASVNRKQKDDVYGTLNMGNTLMNPSLEFGIEAPNTDDIGKKAINEIIADPDERNKQFFALLVLKRFLPKFGQMGGGNNALLDLAETQINSILSGVSENYNLKADLSDGQTTIGVEKQLSDRVTIITSFGVLSNDEAGAGGGIVGDVDIEYRLNDDGTFTMNFFNETNTSSVTSQGQYTQGVSLHYQETFNTTKEFRLWQKFLNTFRRKDKKIAFPKNNNKSDKWVDIPSDTTTTN